jgi:hypothetical protein
MLTKQDIARRLKQYDADETDVADVLGIQELGFCHGKAAAFTIADFADDDGPWAWEVGVDIEQVEMLLLTEPARPVLSIYRRAFAEGAAARKLAEVEATKAAAKAARAAARDKADAPPESGVAVRAAKRGRKAAPAPTVAV